MIKGMLVMISFKEYFFKLIYSSWPL